MLHGSNTTRIGVALVGLTCALAFSACNKGEGKGVSPAGAWVDSPKSGAKSGDGLAFADLGVQFDIPETLYVFRTCGEASHSPNENKWIPVVTCSSEGSVEEGDEDPFAEDEYAEDGAEPIDLTFFVTKKGRPLDERAVTWFENQYKQAGLHVDEISYQGDYQKKTGIYAKLHIMDSSTGTPTREIIQFMFPKDDVVFIAKMEYPFGESRSVDADWKYLLWNFNLK